MHFNMLGECPECYLTHSSFHRSYYRCAVVQGTNSTLIGQNVAYDIIGYCFMLHDGVEEKNTLEYNLAAHIHWMGPEPAQNQGREHTFYKINNAMAFPADVAASGFYIGNGYNNVIGNAASGVSVECLLLALLQQRVGTACHRLEAHDTTSVICFLARSFSKLTIKNRGGPDFTS